jgi:ATP-dependent DNA helicase RecQ
VLEGVTIVVSPLLALMKDQTDKLRKRGIHAARLDSTLTTVGEREMLQEIEEGVRKLIYVTPERAAAPDFKEELGGRPVALFVIDEAHCVSQWGHDFRPSYLNLKRAIELLGRPPVLALTATATPRVVEDIQERLALREPEVVHLGFARPELIFEVRSVPDEKAQVRRLVRLVRRIKGSGIVYASTINTVEALAGALSRLGMRVGKYHGKMSKEDRDTEQHKFMKNQVRVMIATNAFGLGVDKPDIRFVIHYNLPGSIEQYYQEAGRAGRDGKPARGILLWRPGDEEVQKHFNIQKYPGRDQVRSVVSALTAGPGKLEEIALRAGVPQKKAQVVLAMLEESQLAKELPGPIWSPAENAADEATVWRAAEAYRKKREGDRERLQAMLDYAEGRKCRVQFLLGYFGEETPPCGRCDVCTGRVGIGEDEETDEFETARPLPIIPEAPPPPRKDPTTMF